MSSPPGTYKMKMLARENETGKMGTFERTFTIPDLTTQQTVLPISSVILSSQRTALNDAVFNAEKDKKLLTMNPLFQDGKKLVPSVTRVFKTNQEMYVYLEAYEPMATSTQPLVASVAFYRGKMKAFQTDPLEVTEGLNDKSKARAPALRAAAGQYESGHVHLPGQCLRSDESEVCHLANAGNPHPIIKNRRVGFALPSAASPPVRATSTAYSHCKRSAIPLGIRRQMKTRHTLQ